MIRNAEVGQILALVGISPASIPARDPEVAAAHMDVIVRFIGYKAGLEAARRGGEHFDVDADESAVLGRFVRTRLLSSGGDSMHGAALHDMRRMLALVEGATGYRMTSEAVEARAVTFFLKGVLHDIRLRKSYACGGDCAPDSEIAHPLRMTR